MSVRIIHGETPGALSVLDYECLHSCVTDPPYHLTALSRGSSPRTNDPATPFGRTGLGGKGFMGRTWDGGDVAFRPETWAAALRVLKPGAHLIAFGGTRTYHRLACAIEDGGFEIRDQIQWIYGSGFPKSLNLEGEWDGWGTALKPAHEPIVLARKPLNGGVAYNVGRYGVGALNIDGCRIQTDDALTGSGERPYAFRGENPRPSHEASHDRRYAERGSTDFAATPGPRGGDVRGRWPANVIHDGDEEVVSLFPREAGAAAPVHKRNGDKFRNTYGSFAGNVDEAGSTFQGDSGSAARFFYCAKASRADRDDGLGDDFEKNALLWSSGDKNPGSFQSPNTERAVRNPHPTVKPTALMRYLCKLITPPGGVILDPFMGSGSTGRAAVLEGFGFIGVEQDPDYLPIARARIRAVAPADMGEFA